MSAQVCDRRGGSGSGRLRDVIRPEVDLRRPGRRRGRLRRVGERPAAGHRRLGSTRPLIREGAVHIHQGDMYVVDRLDLTAACGTGSQPLDKRAAVTVLDTVPAQPGLPT
jgi:hypothetical protein